MATRGATSIVWYQSGLAWITGLGIGLRSHPDTSRPVVVIHSVTPAWVSALRSGVLQTGSRIADRSVWACTYQHGNSTLTWSPRASRYAATRYCSDQWKSAHSGR